MEQNSHFCRQFQVVKETRLIVGLTGINFQVGTGANFMAPGTVEIAIVVGLFFILFGPTQLPKLARSLGQAKTEFLIEDSQKEEENPRLKQTWSEEDVLKPWRLLKTLRRRESMSKGKQLTKSRKKSNLLKLKNKKSVLYSGTATF